MTPEELATVEARLASERELVAATEQALVAEHEAVVEASAQSNQDDEHDPEGATIGFERARVASLVDQARSHLAGLDQATERLRSGRFGTCQVCGRPIAVERLVAHPVATTCVACAVPPPGAIRRR
jgi:RNA polymerase-binding transcription factor DksA